MKSDKKSTKIIFTVLIVFLATVFVVCGIMLINSLNGYREATDLYDKVHEDFVNAIKPSESQNDAETGPGWQRGEETTVPPETTPPVEDTQAPEVEDTDDGEEDEVTTAPPVYVEPVYSEKFKAAREQIWSLQEVNPDVIGYIYIEFSPTETISYPVVQGDDNEYYVTHAYDKSEVRSGAIFLDCRNSFVLPENRASVLYGHNMNNGAMFNRLTNFKKLNYFNNTKITVYTINGIYTYEVFSAYNTTTESNASQIKFGSDEEFLNFCHELEGRSVYNKKMSFYPDDTIITLSTCLNTYNEARFVVHGVLVSIDW